MLSFDYEKSISQARELRSIASAMRQSSTLSDATNELRTAWSGESADQFLRECQALQAAINKEADAIESIADGLERAANRIAEAERAVISSR